MQALIPSIVHLAKYYSPDQGGMESVTQVLAEGHSGTHRVTVVCFSHGETSQERLRGVQVNRFRIGWLRASQPFSRGYFFGGLRFARQANVVHLHAPNLLASVMSLLLPASCKLVVHWHSDVVGKGWLAYLVRPLEKAMLKRADSVIATSPAYLAHSKPLQSIRRKVKVIPIGIPDPVPTSSDQPLPAAMVEFLQGRKMVLAIGRLVPYKGFENLIAAAASLPDNAAVIIAGGGPLLEQLRQTVHATGLQHKVNLAGRVSNEVLDALFKRAQIFCLPSIERSEAFGVVLLEAMARGIPCVATTIPGSGTAWVNEQDVSGLNVTPKSPLELAEACRRLLCDENLHQKMKRGALERFKSHFSAPVFVERVGRLYDSPPCDTATPSA